MMRKVLAMATLCALLGCGAVAIAAGGGKAVTVTAAVPGGVNESAAVKAKCPAGSTVRAVGFSTRPEDELIAAGVKISGPRTARAAAFNYFPDDRNLKTTAYCGKSGAAIKARSKTVTLKQTQDDVLQGATAKCRDGENLVSGGFAFDETNGSVYVAAASRGGDGWTVKAYNFKDPTRFTSIAYCAKGAPTLSTVSERTTVAGDAPASLNPKCPSKKRAVFGGFKAEVTQSGAFVLLRAAHRSGSGWETAVKNDNLNSSGSFKAYAYCANG